MAISDNPANGFTITIAASGTAQQPATPVPDNCHTMIVFNTDATATLSFAWQTTNAAIAPADGVTVPASTSLTLSIGALSQRPTGGTAGGVTNSLWFDSSDSATLAYITYVNGSST